MIITGDATFSNTNLRENFIVGQKSVIYIPIQYEPLLVFTKFNGK